MDHNEPRSTSSASGVRDKVRDQASHLASEAKETARTRYSEKKDSAVNELASLASALRQVSSESSGSGMIAAAASAAATRVDSLSRSLEGKELDDVFHDVERFARRNPAAFLGSAVAIGFLASRFLKSSGRGGSGFNDYDAYSSEAYGGATGHGMDTAIGTGGYATGAAFTPRATTVHEPIGVTSASDLARGTGSGLGASGSDLDTPGSLGSTSSGLDTPIGGTVPGSTATTARRTNSTTGRTGGTRGSGGSSTGQQ